MTNYEAMMGANFKVECVDVEVVEIPFVSPVHLPFGKIETRPSAWLKVHGEVEGVDGVGAAEGTSLPMKIPLYDDYSGNLKENINHISESVIGRVTNLTEAHKAIKDTEVGGNFATARMTLETGLIDLITRTKDDNVYQTLTGLVVPIDGIAVPYGKSIAEMETDKIIEAGNLAIAKGAQRLKFKVSPKNHEEVLRGISELKSLYPDAAYMVDANGSFDPEDDEHLRMLGSIDDLGLVMIEEPVSRGGRILGLDAHRVLATRTKFHTPIALDDSISTAEDARTAINEGLGEIINLKPGRVGSFIDTLKIVDLAQDRGKQIMVGGMFEATPGRTMTLTLAALCLKKGFDIPGDVSLPQERLAGDLVPEKLKLDKNNNVIFNPKSGWGYEV